MSDTRDDPAALSRAVEHYTAGIAREPIYSVNHANLAALLWRQGDRAAAISAMQRAADLAPAEATWPLNLGVFYEAQNQASRAAEFYQRVLAIRPDWAAAYFWRSNETRQFALHEWQARQPAPAPPAGCVADETASPAQADKTLVQCDQAIASNPTDSMAYLGRGVALAALKRWNEAERALRAADFVGRGGGIGTPIGMLNEVSYYRAVALYGRGQTREAIRMLEQTLDQIRARTFWGPGGDGPAVYGWAVFYRAGWMQDALPDLTIIRFTDEQVNRLLVLGGWYAAAGDVASARRVYQEALQVAPDNSQAKAGLVALEGR